MQATSLSHLEGLTVFWHDVIANPILEKRFDVFEVAIVDKLSIVTTELTREVSQQTPRVRTLLMTVDEDRTKK